MAYTEYRISPVFDWIDQINPKQLKNIPMQKKYKPVTESSAKLGTLVMRGANWCYGDQNDSEIGTVTAVYPNARFEKGWCKVKWKYSENTYRVGADGGKYDLWHFEFKTNKTTEQLLKSDKLIKNQNNGKEKAIKVQRTVRTVRRSNGTRGAVIRCRTSRAKCKGFNL